MKIHSTNINLMFLYNVDGNLNNKIFVDTWDTEQLKLDQVHMYILYLLVSI